MKRCKRFFLSLLLFMCLAGNFTNMRAEESESEEASLLQQLIVAEKLLENTPTDALKILKPLDNPVAYKTLLSELCNEFDDFKTVQDVEILVLNDMLAAYVQIKDLKNAESCLERLIPLLEKNGGMQKWARIYEAVGVAFISKGWAEEGLQLLLRCKKEGVSTETLSLNIAYGNNQIGNFLLAEEYAREAISTLKEKPMLRNRAKIHLATSLFYQDSNEESNALFLEAVKESANNGWDENLLSAVQGAIACLNASDCSDEEKLNKFREYDALVSSVKQSSTDLTTNYLAMKVFFLSKLNKSESVLREIIATCEGYFNRTIELKDVNDLGDFYSERDGWVEGCLKDALSKLGDAKLLSRWESVFETRKQVRDFGEKNPEYNELLKRSLAASNAQRILESNDSSPADKDKARRVLSEHERYFDEFAKKSARNRQMQEALMDYLVVHPQHLLQFSQVIPEDGIFAQYILLEDRISLTLVRKGAPPNYVEIPVNNERLAKAVKSFKESLQRGEENKIKREARALYDMLLRPVEKVIRNEATQTKLILVNTSKELRGIPFCALHDGVRYLAEDYEFVYLSALDQVRLARSPRSAEKKVRVAVFANPDGTLPKSEEEGRMIASLFDQDQTRLFVGEQASLDALRTSLDGGRDIIHFATHGRLDSNNSEQSGLVLADSALWRYKDMLACAFNPEEKIELITLSACDSGKGTHDFEGLALRLAEKSPASSVLAALWKIDDKATRVFMEKFYREIARQLKESGSYERASALRVAQLELIKNEATASPQFWAAFTLFGDFR